MYNDCQTSAEYLQVDEDTTIPFLVRQETLPLFKIAGQWQCKK